MPGKFTDTHCHIFNKDYLIEEGWAIITNTHKNVPLAIAPGAQAAQRLNILSFWTWLINLAKVLIDTPRQNMDELVKAISSTFAVNAGDVAVTPLAMDIFFMLHPPADKPRLFSFLTPKKPAHAVLAEVMQELKYSEDELKEAEEHIKKMAQSHADIQSVFTDKNGFFSTKGYIDHFNTLKQISEDSNRNGDIKARPFLAVDPRRQGIADFMKKYVSAKGPFFGVKLYPRLGVHPQAAGLMPVYEFCADNNIPIITHTNFDGFPIPPFKGYPQFTDPANFEPVLKGLKSRGKKLKIDFAHFACNGETPQKKQQWRDTILELMENYEGVYTDVSAYSTPDEVNDIYSVWSADPLLQQRTMFGTDFDIILVSPASPWGTYLPNFKNKFNKPGEMDQLARVVPNRFFS